jgi:hypothetical protein
MSNNALIRLACIACVPLLDLRLIGNAEADDANPMEPSVADGAKFAVVNSTLVREHKFDSGRTRVDI